MKRWLVAALLAATSGVTPACAQGYVQGSAGLTSMPWLDVRGLAYKMNNGYNIGVSGGVRLDHILGPSWDVRGDIFYTNDQYSCCQAHLGATSLMANLIYHIDLGLPLKPYIGAGLGAVDVHYGNALSGPNESDVRFGGQALAGIEYPLMGRFSLFGEYRFLVASKAQISGLGPVDYQSHNFMAGLKLSL